MATNFPAAFDNNTTLGGPFIDVAPPADPLRNIAATSRNNLNDTVLAIEQRIGFLGDTTTSTLDWATLTVGGVPSQGLRFAGTHAAWPGTTSEAGLFIDSANDHVSFHMEGDPLGTFTDLTAGGGGTPTWDAIYAGGTSLAIIGAALDFQGGHASNPVFRIGNTGTGNLLELWSGTIGAGSSYWSMDPDGAVTHSTVDPTASFAAHSISVTSGGLSAASILSVLSLATTGVVGDDATSAIVGLSIPDHIPGAGLSVGLRVGQMFTKSAVFESGVVIQMPDGSPETKCFEITTANSGPTAMLLQLRDANGSANRFEVDQLGVTYIDAAKDTAYGAAVRIVNTWNANYNGLILELADQNNFRARFSNDGQLELRSTLGIGRALLLLHQSDDSAAFVNYQGIVAIPSSYDANANLTTWQGGSGIVDGPRTSSGTEEHFRFVGMKREEINGNTYWSPYYEHVPGA